MSSESPRDRLPFEPAKNRKKPDKNSPTTAPAAEKADKKSPVSKADKKPPVSREETAIPEVVSKRMASRMAIFCGIPSFLGMFTFVVSYWIVTNKLFELPNVAVVLVSMGFFGLGVLGLTYGVISASWDEEIPGSKLGWSEFTTNFGRMTEAWRSARKKT